MWCRKQFSICGAGLVVALVSSSSVWADAYLDVGLGFTGISREDNSYRAGSSALGYSLGFGVMTEHAWLFDVRYSAVDVTWENLSFGIPGGPQPQDVEEKLTSVTASVGRRFDSSENSSAAWRVGIRSFRADSGVTQSPNAAVLGLELVRPLNEALSFRSSIEMSTYESAEIIFALRWHL